MKTNRSYGLFAFHYKKKILSLPVLMSGLLFLTSVIIFNSLMINFTNPTNIVKGISTMNVISFIFNIFIYSIFIGLLSYVTFKNDILKSYISLEQQTIARTWYIYILRLAVFISIMLTFNILTIALSEIIYIFENIDQEIINSLFRIKYGFYIIYGLFFFSICLTINLLSKGVYDFIFIMLIGLSIAITPFIGSAINSSGLKNKELLNIKQNYTLFNQSIIYGSQFYNEFKNDENINMIFSDSDFFETINNNLQKAIGQNYMLTNWDNLFEPNTDLEKYSQQLLAIFYEGDVNRKITLDGIETEVNLFEGTQISKILTDIYNEIAISPFANRTYFDWENAYTPFYSKRHAREYQQWIEIEEVLNYLIVQLPQYSHLFEFIGQNYDYYSMMSSYRLSRGTINLAFFSGELQRGLFYSGYQNRYNKYDQECNGNGEGFNKQLACLNYKVPEMNIINWIILNSYRSTQVMDVSFFKFNQTISPHLTTTQILNDFKVRSEKYNKINIFNTFFLMYQSSTNGLKQLANFYNVDNAILKTWPTSYVDISSFENEIKEAEENFKNNNIDLKNIYSDKEPTLSKTFSDSAAYFSILLISLLFLILNNYMFKWIIFRNY